MLMTVISFSLLLMYAIGFSNGSDHEKKKGEDE
jgi:hypothetical protein